MEIERKIRKVGNSLGITLPSDFMKTIGLDDGDTVKVGIEGNIIIISKKNDNSGSSVFKEKVVEIIEEYLEDKKRNPTI